jgi:phytoene synthase
LPGPLSVFRGLESSAGEKLALRAARAADPLLVLQQGASAKGFGVALASWRLARQWHRTAG